MGAGLGGDATAEHQLDLPETPPPKRSPKILEASEDLASRDAFSLVNDHEPTPLYHEMSGEVHPFDAEGHTVDRAGPNEFVATLPKQ